DRTAITAGRTKETRSANPGCIQLQTKSYVYRKRSFKGTAPGPRLRMGGYSILARMIDKGRAVLNGTAGEYKYNCGLDQILFGFKRLDHEEVKRFLASGASDEEVLDWIDSHGTPKTSAEIEEFSNSFEKFRPYDNPDLRELF